MSIWPIKLVKLVWSDQSLKRLKLISLNRVMKKVKIMEAVVKKSAALRLFNMVFLPQIKNNAK